MVVAPTKEDDKIDLWKKFEDPEAFKNLNYWEQWDCAVRYIIIFFSKTILIAF